MPPQPANLAEAYDYLRPSAYATFLPRPRNARDDPLREPHARSPQSGCDGLSSCGCESATFLAVGEARCLGMGRDQWPGMLPLRGHDGGVNRVAWSPGTASGLATARYDQTVQIYATDIRSLMALARQRLTTAHADDGCKKYLGVDKCPSIPDLSW